MKGRRAAVGPIDNCDLIIRNQPVHPSFITTNPERPIDTVNPRNNFRDTSQKPSKNPQGLGTHSSAVITLPTPPIYTSTTAKHLVSNLAICASSAIEQRVVDVRVIGRLAFGFEGADDLVVVVACNPQNFMSVAGSCLVVG